MRVNLSLTNRVNLCHGEPGEKDIWFEMNGKTAWGFSAMAFDAARDERCARLLRPIFFQFGVTWFWVALALEGRAAEVWRELRVKHAAADRLRLTGVWADCANGLKEALQHGPQGQALHVPAWTLPDSRKMRSLGLGRMWAVHCPYCHRFHMHSPGEGKRAPHCCADKDTNSYVLEFAGPLPLQHHRRFFRSSRADLPKLLHDWQDDDCHQGHSNELMAA